MRIKYGTPLTSRHAWRACYLGFLVYIVIISNGNLQSFIGEAEKSILESRNTTLTQRLPFLYCNLPFNDCLCSVVSNKSDTSDKCITYAVLVGSRILPMISFFLQIVLVRDIFSFSTDCPRIVIFTLWITSIFAFIGIPISIYWNDCFQVYITLILMFTGMLLSALGIYNVIIVHSYHVANLNRNQAVVVENSEKDNKGEKSWQELI
jgi:hypothetical protein